MHSENWKHCKNHCRAGCYRLQSMLSLLRATFHLVKILDFILQAMLGRGSLEPFKKGRDLFRFVF